MKVEVQFNEWQRKKKTKFLDGSLMHYYLECTKRITTRKVQTTCVQTTLQEIDKNETNSFKKTTYGMKN